MRQADSEADRPASIIDRWIVPAFNATKLGTIQTPSEKSG